MWEEVIQYKAWNGTLYDSKEEAVESTIKMIRDTIEINLDSLVSDYKLTLDHVTCVSKHLFPDEKKAKVITKFLVKSLWGIEDIEELINERKRDS